MERVSEVPEFVFKYDRSRVRTYVNTKAGELTARPDFGPAVRQNAVIYQVFVGMSVWGRNGLSQGEQGGVRQGMLRHEWDFKNASLLP